MMMYDYYYHEPNVCEYLSICIYFQVELYTGLEPQHQYSGDMV